MSALSIGDIRTWRSSQLAAADLALGATRDVLTGVTRDLSVPGPSGWQGEAATAAYLRRSEIVAAQHRLVAGIAAVQSAVGDAAGRVRAVQLALEQAERVAAAFALRVLDNGSVTDHGRVPGPLDPRDAAAAQRDRERAREEARAWVVQTLRTAADLDADLSVVLLRAARDQVAEADLGTPWGAWAAGAQAGRSTPVAPPKGATPFANAAWWVALTAAEQTDLQREHPAWLGGLDGLPAAVRDRVNRQLLDTLEAEAVRRRDARPGRPDPAAVSLLAAISAVRRTLARPGGPRQLLALDATGRRVKAAVAVGDVDRADHVVVFTPGLGSTVEGSLEGYVAELDAIHREVVKLVNRQDDPFPVAAVTWLDYEAPQWAETLDPTHSVLLAGAARAGADRLSSFLNGLDAAREVDPHLTAAGHSYGSTTTGLALQRGTGVDEAVFLGSPGVGTGSVAKLALHPGHGYQLEARGDPVADLGRFGPDPSTMAGLVPLSTAAAVLPDGRRLRESVGHSEYLKKDTTSAFNIAAVAAGRSDLAVAGSAGAGVGDAARAVLPWVVGPGPLARAGELTWRG